jgi:hypothetical protein
MMLAKIQVIFSLDGKNGIDKAFLTTATLSQRE